MPEYSYFCPKCKNEEEVIHSIRDCDKEILCECGAIMHRSLGTPRTQVNGMNAAGGYSNSVADIQKTMGRPIENSDLDRHVSTQGKIND